MNDMHKVIWPGWEIVRRIGSGSFGTVYEIQRDVYGDIEKAALKVIQLPRSEDEVDYLRCTGLDDASITMNFHQQVGDIAKEYKLMAQMRANPNVVRCDDFRDIQHDDGLGWDIYIKMELLSPLMKNLDKVSTEEQIIQLGKDICNALISCQEKNIIHRDIKPQNVFISDTGVFKLGDFGIARTIEHATQATGGIGTYSYMAPEVERNLRYDCTVDIYSVGLMMYWLLNERRGAFMPLPPAVPGYGDEEKARQRRFSGEAIPAPKHGSEALKAIVLKACAFTPADRYQSAQEMWDALCALGGTAPVSGVAAGVAAGIAAGAVTAAADTYEDEDRTIGPGSTVPPKRVPVQEVVAEPEEVYEEDEKTVGPAFVPVDKKPVKVEKPKPVKTAPPKPAKVEKPKPVKEPKEKSDKKSPILYILLGAVGAVILLFLLLLIPSCDTDPGYEPIVTTEPTEITTAPTDTTESTEPVGTAPALQVEWSEWADKLPENVTAELYDIEEKTLYSSRNLETTSSSNKTMDGWELFDTVEAGDGFGPWSDWSQSSVKESATRDVDTQTRYRYRTKETTTSTSSTKSGWTMYDKKVTMGDYGSWSSWSPNYVQGSNSRKVQQETQYRTYQIGNAKYEWKEGSWTTTQQAVGETVRLKSTRSTYQYFYYACSCNNCQLRTHTNTSKCPGCDCTSFRYVGVTSSKSPSQLGFGYFQDGCDIGHDGVSGQIFMRSGSNNATTEYLYETRTTVSGGDKVYTSDWSFTEYKESGNTKVETRTVYRYQDRSQITLYYFYKWGNWSSWSPSEVSKNNDRDVESTTFYRYRDKVSSTTYYFRRWTEWSEFTDGEVTKSDTVEVQTKTQYRYKSKASE